MKISEITVILGNIKKTGQIHLFPVYFSVLMLKVFNLTQAIIFFSILFMKCDISKRG